MGNRVRKHGDSIGLGHGCVSVGINIRYLVIIGSICNVYQIIKNINCKDIPNKIFCGKLRVSFCVSTSPRGDKSSRK
jgi:hypothetical protein